MKAVPAASLASAPSAGQSDSVRRWTNLLIAALAFFWLAQVAFDVVRGNFFGRLAIDAASFWSAGYIANHFGYAGVYDLGLMTQVQRPLLPANAAGAFAFHPIPTPYLPVFLLPFQLMALLPPIPAASLWIVANAIGTVIYLRSLFQRITGETLATRNLALMLVSAPVFLNLFTGQINLLLMIGIGEFIDQSIRGRELRAGLWLGLLLIKPQFLVLLVPALLLQRHLRMIFGWLLSAALVLGASLLLAGPEALIRTAHLWLGYAAGAGLPSNDLPLMMNWRMLDQFLGNLLPLPLAHVIGWTGLALTIVAALALWARRVTIGSQRYFAALLGLLAATGAAAWHSHVHAAMIVIPAMLILQAQPSRPLGYLVEWWSLMPAGLYAVRLVLAALYQIGLLPNEASLYLDFLGGIGLFAMNLVLLAWALRLHRADSALPA